MHTDHWPFDCPYSINISILGIVQKSIFDPRAAQSSNVFYNDENV